MRAPGQHIPGRPAAPAASLRQASLIAVALLTTALPLWGQGNLDRSPNLSGDWVVRPGIVQFNFLHRFTRSEKPVAKVTNFPTFVVATSLLRRTTLGATYATNSTLAPAFPNEWEFFARAMPLAQASGAPVDLAAQVGWNNAADGLDAELTVGRTFGPLRVLAAGRALSDPFTRGGGTVFAAGAGGVLRFTRHLGVHGDYVRLTRLDASRDERAAWSAGVALAIPNTPHTLSLHATNANTGTLQGSSRGGSQVRYGFEFTIPITLARYFGRRPPPAAPAPAGAPAAAAPGRVPVGPVTGPLTKVVITGLQFPQPALEIAVGTTVEWKNEDPVPHTVTADNGSFDSGMIEGGQTWRYTFTTPGTYAYSCTPHPFMKATVVVK